MSLVQSLCMFFIWLMLFQLSECTFIPVVGFKESSGLSPIVTSIECEGLPLCNASLEFNQYLDSSDSCCGSTQNGTGLISKMRLLILNTYGHILWGALFKIGQLNESWIDIDHLVMTSDDRTTEALDAISYDPIPQELCFYGDANKTLTTFSVVISRAVSYYILSRNINGSVLPSGVETNVSLLNILSYQPLLGSFIRTINNNYIQVVSHVPIFVGRINIVINYSYITQDVLDCKNQWKLEYNIKSCDSPNTEFFTFNYTMKVDVVFYEDIGIVINVGTILVSCLRIYPEFSSDLDSSKYGSVGFILDVLGPKGTTNFVHGSQLIMEEYWSSGAETGGSDNSSVGSSADSETQATSNSSDTETVSTLTKSSTDSETVSTLKKPSSDTETVTTTTDPSSDTETTTTLTDPSSDTEAVSNLTDPSTDTKTDSTLTNLFTDTSEAVLSEATIAHSIQSEVIPTRTVDWSQLNSLTVNPTTAIMSSEAMVILSENGVTAGDVLLITSSVLGTSVDAAMNGATEELLSRAESNNLLGESPASMTGSVTVNTEPSLVINVHESSETFINEKTFGSDESKDSEEELEVGDSSSGGMNSISEANNVLFSILTIDIVESDTDDEHVVTVDTSTLSSIQITTSILGTEPQTPRDILYPSVMDPDTTTQSQELIVKDMCNSLTTEEVDKSKTRENTTQYISITLDTCQNDIQIFDSSGKTCQCQCRRKAISDLILQEQIQDKVEKIVKRLIVDKRVLSATTRKLTSATDPRKSSQTIGAIGIGLLITVGALIVSLDLPHIIDLTVALRRKLQTSTLC